MYMPRPTRRCEGVDLPELREITGDPGEKHHPHGTFDPTGLEELAATIRKAIQPAFVNETTAQRRRRDTPLAHSLIGTRSLNFAVAHGSLIRILAWKQQQIEGIQLR